MYKNTLVSTGRHGGSETPFFGKEDHGPWLEEFGHLGAKFVFVPSV